MDVGFDALGKRKAWRFSARTKTEEKGKLRDLLRQVEQGIDVSRSRVTVADVVDGWLPRPQRSKSIHGQDLPVPGRNPHPSCGGNKKLADLKVQDIDRLLHGREQTLSTGPWAGSSRSCAA